MRLLFFASLTFVLSARGAPLDYNRDIQPILSENCYHCHGPDAAERKADLRLDDEKAAKAPLAGTLPILPGNSHDSTIIQRIFSTDPDEVMPTPKSNRRLTEAQKHKLKQWIDEGAKWGKHWAFERVERPVKPVPNLAAPTPSQNPIDAFVRAKLTEKGLKPSPKAAPETLVRRLHLDLTGLPPSPDEVRAFVTAFKSDPHSAVAQKVTRLLASPAYGERWAWDWMDAARYADTNGYQGDPERTMWPWRDWVVKAINTNLPYDDFTVWQLAGDLLPNATLEQKLATGFNRNHMMNGEGGRIAEETRVENVMDRVETTGTVWMGLTVGCCRCHDHKFDPLAQKDYFALYDCFNQISEDGKIRGGQAAPAMDLSSEAEKQRLAAAEQKAAAAAEVVDAFELKKFPRPEGKTLSDSEASKLPGNLSATLAKVAPNKRGVDALLEAIGYFEDKDPEYTKVLRRLLAAVREKVNAAASITRVMIMDVVPTPRETFILDKGAYDKPLATKVTFAPPASLPPLPAGAPKDRLGLAQWLIARDHPLTARVTVNRFWQAFFGIGLVKTAEDFGVQGEKPEHQALLDWLAVEFIEGGWDVKALMQLIVTSETYQQASHVGPEREADPENRFLSRGPRFRMPSWMLRDQALAVSGLLQTKLGGPAVKPYQPEGIWEEATFGKKSYVQDHGDALYRRTLYTFWRRIVGPTMLFDNAARQTCTVKSVRTNTPLHALVTMNETTFVECARALAERVVSEKGGNDETATQQMFQLVTCRPPNADETQVLLRRLKNFREQFHAQPASAEALLKVGESRARIDLPAAEKAAWTSLGLLLLNLDETLTKE